MKRFLRRFDKLEHKPFNLPKIPVFKKSKRFEYLEIGDKRIEFTITDNISQLEESQSSDITYYILCPYCGKENEASQNLCIHCRHELKTKLTDNYQTVAHLLKKCASCGSMNLKERLNCWVCGKKISESASKKDVNNSENVITLTIDGKTYSSCDPNLPFEIRVLMEKVRVNGYDKTIVEEWVKKRNQETELQFDFRSGRLNQIRLDIIWRVIAIIALLLFFSGQLRFCFRI